MVELAECGVHAHLNGFLAQQRSPQAELALALQCGALGIETPDQHHVSKHPGGLGRSQRRHEIGVLDEGSVLTEQLHRGHLDWLRGLEASRRGSELTG